MVDLQTVCCMCGDVGFPEKLFRCIKCRYRFQHSYCSNYYGLSSHTNTDQCDWCQSEELKNNTMQCHAPNTPSSKKSGQGSSRNNIIYASTECCGERIMKSHHREETSAVVEKGKSPSPRTSTRRYKLLKDVMC